MFWAIGSVCVLLGVLAFERAWVKYQSTPVADRWWARRKAAKDRVTAEERELEWIKKIRKESAEMRAKEKDFDEP